MGLAGIAGVVALALGMAVQGTASSAQAPDPVVGVGVHELDASSIAALRDLGVRDVRITLYWGKWEHEPAYRRQFTRELDAALDAGLDPLIVVHQQPRGGYADREWVYRAFADFVADRARQFPHIRAWQLWNEMDVAFTDVFGAGDDRISLYQRGRNYGHMLEIAWPAIKRANPDALIVTGGIASEIDGGFIEGILDVGAPFDALAIHTYGFPVMPSFRDRGIQARRLLDRHGDSRPIWNTEFGMEKAVVPRDWPRSDRDVDGYHLDAWSESIQLNADRHIYQRAYGHVLKQGGDLSFDLVRTDGSPRPAYRWLRDWMRAH